MYFRDTDCYFSRLDRLQMSLSEKIPRYISLHSHGNGKVHWPVKLETSRYLRFSIAENPSKDFQFQDASHIKTSKLCLQIEANYLCIWMYSFASSVFAWSSKHKHRLLLKQMSCEEAIVPVKTTAIFYYLFTIKRSYKEDLSNKWHIKC